MPVRVIGMIGVAPPAGDATVHVIKGGISPSYLAAFAQAHEAAGFDLVLVGYTASSAEGFLVAQYAAHHTGRLGFLIAHRPGFVAPTLAARKIATFDHLTGGRLALHVISGASDAEQHGDGDFAPKEERYRRAAEYLEVMKLAWTSEQRFDFAGEFYHVQGAHSDVRPLRKPHPPLFFGGSSEGALAMGAKHCDVFAAFGEPLAATAERIAEFRARAAAYGRTPAFNMSFRPILAATEGAAWDRARRILASIRKPGDPTGFGNARKPLAQSARRLLDFAAKGETHDERLWMPIAEATGAVGNTSCLVGTPEQVARALLEYYKLGVHSFLLRGFDPFEDAVDFGRELIPRLRVGAEELDGAKAA
ncbi:LLM class flavin-dependent oxidoreductase [Enhydrobacter sp.]|jgi:alkanesulfonate monooxygenase|uniref:LLM class flavin-dependent oxidoreductase n=1 Tax=Enhydrobacter sp. TaxID=1894999 RepID=UPI0026311E9D|nr:LLM class flavin-dependent oxidoreductase [Enhydrobacter sp.]WIM09928.1 MAG: Aliphatic sulfonate monooxygenase family, FMNH2- or F420-dependent [Enhydrobacter sp.]